MPSHRLRNLGPRSHSHQQCRRTTRRSTLNNVVPDFDAPFRRHLHAAHTLVKAAVPDMEAAGYGRIVRSSPPRSRNPFPTSASRTPSVGHGLLGQIHVQRTGPLHHHQQCPAGFTDTERLGNLSASIQERTGKSAEAVREGWLGQVSAGSSTRLNASAITYLCLPASGGIRGVSLAVDGGRLRSI